MYFVISDVEGGGDLSKVGQEMATFTKSLHGFNIDGKVRGRS